MAEHASHPPHPPWGTIGSQDHFMERLYSITESTPEGEVDKTKEIFSAFSQLLEWSKKLARQLESFIVSLSYSGSREEEALNQV